MSITASAPAIDRLKNRLLDHARDLRINLGVVSGATALSPQQAWGTAVAAAITSRNLEVITAVEEAAAAQLSPEALAGARGAASIMGMNNIYYRFLHMMGDGTEYAQMPARLRMQIIGKPGSTRSTSSCGASQRRRSRAVRCACARTSNRYATSEERSSRFTRRCGSRRSCTGRH